MKTLVETAVSRPVGTLMAAAALVLLSCMGALTLGLSAFPDLEVPKLAVSVAYPGVPAREVRTLVTIPVEGALASVRGLRHITSVSRDGITTVSLELDWGTDLRAAGAEVRETLATLFPLLPSGTSRPQVLPVDPADEPLAVLGVYPKDGNLTRTKALAALVLRTKLQQVPGVGAVVLVGGTTEEVLVEVSRDRSLARGLTLEDLIRTVGVSVWDGPAGTLAEAGEIVAVKVRSGPGSPEELVRLPVPLPGGASVTLGDLASVSLGTAGQKSAFSQAGTEGVGLYIHGQPGANPVAAVEGIRTLVRAWEQDHRGAWDIRLEFDGTQEVRRGLETLGTDALLGILAAFLVVWLFVRDPAASLVVMVSVLVSLALALGFLKLTGRSLNILSLGGLALSLGMMVDHGVVVVENLHRRTAASGQKNRTLVAQATSELSLTNIGSTGTAVIVFVPVIFLPGVAGQLFADLSAAVIGAHLASFLVSVTLAPALYLLVPTRSKGVRSPWQAKVQSVYLRCLFRFLRKPGQLILCLGMTAAAGLAALAFLRFEIQPATDEGYLDLTATLPAGTPVDRASSLARGWESQLSRVAGVARVYSRTGTEDDDLHSLGDPEGFPETIRTRVVLSGGPRPPADVMAARLRELPCPGATATQVLLPPGPLARLLGTGSPGYGVWVTGPDPEGARLRADQLVQILGPDRTWVSPGGNRTEIRFIPDPASGFRTGVTLAGAAAALRAGTDGAVAAYLTAGDLDLPVRVRYQGADHRTLEQLSRFPVRGAPGELVPLGSVGTFSETSTAIAFCRVDRKDGWLVRSPQPVPGPEITGIPGTWDPGQDGQRDLGWALVRTFGLVLVLVYLFLGTQLGSFLLPLLVMSAIPLAFSGVTVALALGGAPASLSALLGVVTLVGLVINNSILLFQSYRDYPRGPGSGWAGTILGGSLTRWRPVLMTAAVTILSLAPLAFDPRGTPESVMALAILGGLAVSTALTLFVVPLLFTGWFRSRGGRL